MFTRNINIILILNIFIVCSFCFIPLNAQEIHTKDVWDKIEFEQVGDNRYVDKYTSEIFSDSKGFIWFGSYENGLNKYNGYEFENYSYKYNDSLSLIKNNVNNILLEDSSGNIWFTAGYYSLHRYNRATNDITRFQYDPNDVHSIFSGKISSVVEDSKGNIWVGCYGGRSDNSEGGIAMFDRSSGKFIRHKIKSLNTGSYCDISSLYSDTSGILWAGTYSGEVIKIDVDDNIFSGEFIYPECDSDSINDLFNFTIGQIIEDGSGSIWFGTDGNGVFRYEKDKGRIRRYLIVPERYSAKNTTILLSMDQEGVLWIGTGEGLAMYDKSNDTIITYCHDPDDPFSITPGFVNSIVNDDYGSLWLTTKGGWFSAGINRFDKSTGKFHLYKNDPQDPASLSTDLVNTLYIDKSGIIWIGTYDGGINRFDPHKRKFNLYRTGSNGSLDMPQGRIQSVIEDYNGILWIGTHGYGLFRFDRERGEITNFKHDPNNPKSINNNTILTICEERPGILWIGGLGGLKRLDTRTMEFKKFTHAPDDPGSLKSDHILYIMKDSSGMLWVGMVDGGINRFDQETEKFESLKFSNGRKDFHENTVFVIYEDSKRTVWVGGYNGLYKFIPADSSFIQYKHDDNNPGSISANVVRAITEDRSGDLWIGTEGGGLNKFDVKNETFRIFTTANGLPCNVIWGILTDDNDNLWLSTNRGLSKFNMKTEVFTNYDQSDGLQGAMFNFNAFCKSRSGELFLGGDHGINYFFPDSIKKNSFVPPVILTDFKLFNKSVPIKKGSLLDRSISELTTLDLKYNENFISFEFAALNYTNSHKNRYKYIMTGLDPDTIYAGTRRFAEYTDLKPGEYTFWVTGSNNDGVWNKYGVSLDIVVHPPWWKSRLAYGIYFLTLILSVTGLVNRRTRKLRKDKEELERLVKERTHDIEERDIHILEMDRMKTRFFANISHEFRTPLTLIISPLEELLSDIKKDDKNYKKLTAVKQSGLKLLSLVNQLLDLSKMDSGKLKLELSKADIVGALNLLFSSFISLADKKRIDYKYQLPDKKFITYFDKNKLETITNNLLSNAFKYTPAGGNIECMVNIRNIADEKQGHQLVDISIKDSGPGIAEDKHKKIFNRFYQVDESYHSEGGGSGIGLSLTRELTELLHGKINVKSKPGEGSCFNVTIPVGTEHLKGSEYVIVETEKQEVPVMDEKNVTNDLPENESAGGHVKIKESFRILIVEDNEELRSYLKEHFQKVYRVDEASDGEEGLEIADRTIPDLIITDVMMPVMGGVEFCRLIKTHENTSHIPVVMLTAKADMASKIEGLETGADDYMIKPFHFHELITRVQNLIEQRQKLRKRYSANLDMLPEEISFNSYDLKFIKRIIGIVEDNLIDFDFDVDTLLHKSGMSHPQLYRKLSALTGLSPSKFIRALRLKQATKLMKQKKERITDIAFSVGFNNLSYFIKCFKEQYGISPSEYYRKYPAL
jgi:signal transduction histidine kinase/ligand-binding sensor domain-containing protein/AraC-like DNA-binding protein